ncbi:MAG: glycosyltransferase [Pseudomonadota bacterium]
MASIDYTVVVTSCGRFDLLAQTLSSLFAHVDVAPVETVIIEDSGASLPENAIEGVSGPKRIIQNPVNLGQMASIDRAYAKVSTPLVFHCEDDWAFLRGGFIRQSADLLAAMPDVSMVSLRARGALNPLLRHLPSEIMGEVPYFRARADLHPEYFGYSFNPGLRRKADYDRFAPLAAIGHEADVSHAFKRAGFVMAYLEEPAVEHIGEGRHVDDPAAPKRPTNTIERLKRSAEKRVKRLKRSLAGPPPGSATE